MCDGFLFFQQWLLAFKSISIHESIESFNCLPYNGKVLKQLMNSYCFLSAETKQMDIFLPSASCIRSPAFASLGFHVREHVIQLQYCKSF